mmetsp:Transcript_60966/g.170546  ORF Transcript_60966/g.170546 Transcript_60966/m.170546 type:complete len:397 (-) Transcript_60966:211-1401(-)
MARRCSTWTIRACRRCIGGLRRGMDPSSSYLCRLALQWTPSIASVVRLQTGQRVQTIMPLLRCCAGQMARKAGPYAQTSPSASMGTRRKGKAVKETSSPSLLHLWSEAAWPRPSPKAVLTGHSPVRTSSLEQVRLRLSFLDQSSIAGSSVLATMAGLSARAPKTGPFLRRRGGEAGTSSQMCTTGPRPSQRHLRCAQRLRAQRQLQDQGRTIGSSGQATTERPFACEATRGRCPGQRSAMAGPRQRQRRLFGAVKQPPPLQLQHQERGISSWEVATTGRPFASVAIRGPRPWQRSAMAGPLQRRMLVTHALKMIAQLRFWHHRRAVDSSAHSTMERLFAYVAMRGRCPRRRSAMAGNTCGSRTRCSKWRVATTRNCWYNERRWSGPFRSTTRIGPV